MSAQPPPAPIVSVVRRGAGVLAALRREYAPALWRREALAQIAHLLTGRLAGRQTGRDHDGLAARRYGARDGGPALWIRHGGGDAAVWGEINAREVYAAPWPVPPGLRVLDLGGHAGYFARFALERWAAASVLSVEPDPANAELLARNRDEVGDARWTLLVAAAATTTATAPFAGGRGCASGLDAGGDETVATVDALALLAGCDLAKVDIEGGEWALLADPRFAASAPPMIVLEYHATAAIPAPQDEARRWLQRAGYAVGAAPAVEEVAGVGVLWGRRASSAQTTAQ